MSKLHVGEIQGASYRRIQKKINKRINTKLRPYANQKHRQPDDSDLRLHYCEELHKIKIHSERRKNSTSKISCNLLKNLFLEQLESPE